MSTNASSRRNSIFIAAGIAIAFVAWLLSGLGNGGAAPESPVETRSTLMRVTVRHSKALPTTRNIVASARTEPNRVVELKAETEGRVVAIGAERGAPIDAGQTIVTIDLRDRKARLDEANALIKQRELEYEAAKRLRDREFMSEAELAGAEAQLVSARAARERIQLDIEHTQPKAPFDAIVYDRLVEIGDYVSVGETIAQLVDTDPLIVVGNINERDVGALAVGSRGVARVLDGPEISGTVRYLAPVADDATRSYRLEVAIPNPDRSLRIGASAQLVLGAGSVTAHRIETSVLTLADDGTVGVKTVDAGDTVRFYPIQQVGSVDRDLLVTGPPEDVRIITVGQGFVTDGQTVIPVEEGATLTDAQNERAY